MFGDAARERFTSMVQLDDDDIDLLAAVLLIAQEEYPRLSVATEMARVDGLAEEVAFHVDLDTPTFQALYTINQVLYVQHRFRGNSRIGVMYTGRVSTAEASDDNHLLDVDGRVWLGESTFVEGYAAATRTPGLEGREHSFYVNLSHEGRTWLPRVSYMEAGDNFNPEVGFVSRVGFRVPTVSLQRRIRVPSVSWLREVRPQLHWNGFWNLDDFLETHAASLRVRADLADGGSLQGSFSHTIEGLEEPFDIHPGVRVPAGSYENVEATLGFATDPSVTIAVSGSLDAGGFFSGSRVGLSGTLAARRGAIVSGELRAGYNRIRLPEGDFDTRLVGVRLGVFPTAALSLRALVQYSSQAEAWTGNVRVGWLQAAGTGLFVVYNHSRRTGERAGPLHRGLTVKYSRRFDLAW